MRNPPTILRLPLRSEERVSRHWLDLVLHRRSGSVTSASTLRRASQHHRGGVPLPRHRSPASSHPQGSKEPIQSLSSRSRSSELNERAIRAAQTSEELCTYTSSCSPLASLSPSCGPLLASSPNSPTVKHETLHHLRKFSVESSSIAAPRRAPRKTSAQHPIPCLASSSQGTVSTSRRTLRRPETSAASQSSSAVVRPASTLRRAPQPISRPRRRLMSFRWVSRLNIQRFLSSVLWVLLPSHLRVLHASVSWQATGLH